MKYREMTKFLNRNGISAIQPVIASEVSVQLENDIPDDEFEEICEQVFDTYRGCIEEPDIWYLVDEVLSARGYKSDWDNEDYVPSAERGDYSPSNPWDAPGMKMSDFI